MTNCNIFIADSPAFRWPCEEAGCAGSKCGCAHCSGPVSCSNLGRQCHLYLSCSPSFCLCLSPDCRQLKFVCWALCIYEPEQTFTSANNSSGGGRGERLQHQAQPWLLTGCHRPGLQTWHTARRKRPVGLETPALPSSLPASSLFPHLPP